MINEFKKYIQENILWLADQKIILAVSGGIDSVVMTHLFTKSAIPFVIAHCNFRLRGKESDEDQSFVEQLAKNLNTKFFTVSFDTLGHSEKEKISIQMAARELRYKWFKKLAIEIGYNYIAIAHNRDDVAETMLINLFRGTGLKGLGGIKPIQGIIIRPLLFAARTDIEEFAISEKITYREDSSNSESKYHRNLIRNEIIPLIRKINPSINETLYHEAEIFTSTFQLYKREVDKIKELITLDKTDKWIISISKIRDLQIDAPLLFEMLTPYGFSYSSVISIINSLQAESGRKFYSDKYILLKDRNTLIIKEIEKNEAGIEYEIPQHCNHVSLPIAMNLTYMEMTSDFKIPPFPTNVAFDAEKLIFPLKIRKWKAGDFFIPLGMTGKKKLSDFFIDKKINLFEKERTWLLVSNEQIVWIIGYQINDRYKITAVTRKVLLVSLID
jgi:tRNA(Ile)-lysidine synthase